MDQNNPKEPQSSLRRQAEVAIQGKLVDLQALSFEDIQHLIQELQVHQIELELQNEQLRQAHRELEATRNKFVYLYDFAPVSYVTIDKQGRIWEANLTAVVKLGLERGNIVRHLLSSFVVPEDQDAYYLWRRNLFKGTEAQVCELRLVRRDGTQFHVQLEGVVAGETDIEESLARVAITDISQLKATEKALREAETRWRTLLQNLPDYVILLDAEARVLFTNYIPAGLTFEEVLGTSLFDYVPVDQRSVVQQALKQVRESGEVVDYEIIRTTSAGKTYWTNRAGPVNYEDKAGFVIISTDITQRSQAERALRESEERFRQMFEQGPIGLMILDLEHRLVRVNLKFCQMMEYDEAQLVQLRLQDITHPDDTEKSLQFAHRILSGEVPASQLEKRYLTKTGRTIWVRLTAALIRDEAGHPQYGLGMVEDITESREAQLALQESQRLIQQISDAAPYIVYLYDVVEQRNIYVNQQIFKTLGYTPAEIQIIGPDFIKNFCHPDDLESVLAQMRRLSQSQKDDIFENEYRMKHANGEWRWLASRDAIFSRDAEGNPRQIIGTAHDITERKQADLALAEERQLLRTLIDNLPDYIYVKDGESHFITGNTAVARVMGAQEVSHLTGKSDSDFYPPELAQQFRADEEAVIESGRPLLNKEELIIDGEGQERTISTTKVPLRDREGQIVGLVGIGRDITQRKKVENERAQLFAAVSQKREELRALAARLAEVQETERQQLARELHDQAGQNLTALGFNLNFILSQLGQPSANIEQLKARLEDSLILVEQTTDRIRNVMSDLHPPMLDDYGLLDALEWYAVRFARRMQLEVKVRGEAPEPRLSISTENTLFRITQEALNNVAKHAQATQVVISLSQTEAAVFLTITDNGIGFDPTYRNHTPFSPSLGLLTMKERAETIGGSCRIESSPGEGTRVIIEVLQ